LVPRWRRWFAMIMMAALLSSIADMPLALEFDVWGQRYRKKYRTVEERDQRRGHFEARRALIQSLQRGSPHAHFTLDETADWSDDEWRARTAGGPPNLAGMPNVSFPPFVKTANDSGLIDWVAKGAVTRPESQGRCGTCLDFSGTANVESARFIAGHAPLTRLSVQMTVDCCVGGPGYCMDWIRDHGGLATEADYPLANHSDPTIHGCRSACNQTAAAKRSATIDSVSCLDNHDEDQILSFLQEGPVSVSIAAKYLNGYHSGIINCTAEGIDHAVLLVGFGVENGTHFWKLRNSWGPAFGEHGFFRFVRGNLCLRGPCQARAPKVDPPPLGALLGA